MSVMATARDKDDVVRHATDQVKAQAAWAAFQKWQRIDYSANPKYDIAP
jgi:hypothetical protein